MASDNRDPRKVLIVNNSSLAKYWPGARSDKASERLIAEPPPVISPEEYREPDTPAEKKEAKGSEIKAGCIPCSIGHFSACSGLLKEGIRFAQDEGIASDVPIDRIGACLDELNALERKDLTPALIDTLPAWEKALALRALAASRKTRHALEGVQSVDDLIHTSAETDIVRKQIGREWFKHKLEHMTPREKQDLAAKVTQRLEEGVKT